MDGRFEIRQSSGSIAYIHEYDWFIKQVMTDIHKSALVPYSAEQMFDLVNDIEAYAGFLPWCRSSKVLSAHDNVIEASLEIAHGALHKTFTTRNTLTDKQQIQMNLVEGPFKQLEGVWRFEALGDQGSKVSLDLSFEFSNRLVGMTMGPIFSAIANSLVDAFTQEAVKKYG